MPVRSALLIIATLHTGQPGACKSLTAPTATSTTTPSTPLLLLLLLALLTLFMSLASQMVTDRSLEPEMMYLPSWEKHTEST